MTSESCRKLHVLLLCNGKGLFACLVILPILLLLTSARAYTVSWQPYWSSWACGGEPVKAWSPLVFPVSQSVYNSTTAGCHGVTVNELQMPGVRANQGEALSHHSPQVPPSETLLRACSSHSSPRPQDLLLALHYPVFYSTSGYNTINLHSHLRGILWTWILRIFGSSAQKMNCFASGGGLQGEKRKKHEDEAGLWGKNYKIRIWF